MTTETLTNEMRALLALITNEWRPLPLAEIASITGCAAVQGGNVLRHRLNLWTPPGGADTEPGRVYIHDRFGMRLARCYRATNEGTRYWWRRFPAEASDADIVAEAMALSHNAHLFGSKPPKMRKQPARSLFAPTGDAPAPASAEVAVTAPPVAPVAPVVVMDDIAGQIAKARAATEQAEAAWLQCATELEQLEAVRRARIEALQAEIARLSSV
jgi:hypothetical protein